MIYDGAAPHDADAARTGGVPLAPEGAGWPACADCGGPMQFFAHLPVEDVVLSVFLCRNDPGACESWDAASGANRVFLFPRTGLVPMAVPREGVTLLPAVSAVRTEAVPFPPAEDGGYGGDGGDGDPYDLARSGWKQQPGERFGKQREVLGSLGGAPSYLEDERVPECPGCSGAMEFAAHLEEGFDHRYAMNLGGDLGYVFVCRPCGTGAFLTG